METLVLSKVSDARTPFFWFFFQKFKQGKEECAWSNLTSSLMADLFFLVTEVVRFANLNF